MGPELVRGLFLHGELDEPEEEPDPVLMALHEILR